MVTDIPTNNAYYLMIAGSSKSIFSQLYYDGNFSKEVEFALEGRFALNLAEKNRARDKAGF